MATSSTLTQIDMCMQGLDEDTNFQQALKTAYGKRADLRTAYGAAVSGGAPMSQRLATASGRGMTGRGMTARGKTGRISTARLTTGYAAEGEGGEPRKIKAVEAVGFVSSRGNSAQPFDPSRSVGSAKPLEKAEDSSEEAALRVLEDKVHRLLEESAEAIAQKDFQKALEKAKAAGVHERELTRKKEAQLGPEQINLDLTFAVLVHLAYVQEQCEMYPEAINTLLVLVKNKTFDRAGRLRVNIGNIYFKQQKYLQAVKQYRMALDQIPSVQQEMRSAVLKNIGQAFIRMGQYGDAMKTFEHVLEETPPGDDFDSALNCLLCYFGLGDREKMKRGFARLLSLQLPTHDEDERYMNIHEDEQVQIYLDAVQDDTLRKHELATKKKAEEFVLKAAKLIAPVIESSFAEGYDWCIERVKGSAFSSLASELEITKAITYLKLKDVKAAAKVLKSFEKKESNMLSTAATNLSFLYILENDVKQAERYADLAMDADKYNHCALVNKGNCAFMRKRLEEAQELYQEALAIDSSCSEALFNLGLVHRDLGNLEDALEYFHRVNLLVPDTPEVVAAIAALNEQLDDTDQACEWYNTLISLVPSDPNALAHLGDMFDRLDDKSQAFQYHFEGFRYFPAEINTISWFGSYYIDSQYIQKAIQFFQRAVEIQPGEVKWRLMIASCHRKTGNYQRALETYKRIHTLFPENIECLKFLIRLCTDMGLPEVQDYAVALKKAEQAKERRERAASGRGSARRSGRRGSRQASGKRQRSGHRAREERRSGRDSARSVMSSDDDRDGRGTADFGGSTRGPTDFSASLNRTNTLDASYKDPVGALPVRPKTAARKADDGEDSFELDEDMLPE
ncbi:hypothetical protein PTSG_11061 [Salpingoeca rosetta]|uniref:Intraflagellar transport protein 88 n=1 Tax=Salpingoeca rosetta (strain ATCC 50818 / BSB-021) TaxID=946362 RepID=F2US11_SALR5|nr:uncharacterized protein PTSG_11061 [Salpingoeca rosetta]EGD80416.1 hypothetical protein PTSG_11061 [Salpingoeca rosetta]|eukprot:XP_004987980.1 hypothetical protein PTSG_11061 [Salpingoeca rosetta]